MQSEIPNFSTAEESDAKRRFMLIVKWYLSSFHTGRKGAIAKKPFNPILGEIFRCHWHLPTRTTAATSSTSAQQQKPNTPSSISNAANTRNDQTETQQPQQKEQINDNSVNENSTGAQNSINTDANSSFKSTSDQFQTEPSAGMGSGFEDQSSSNNMYSLNEQHQTNRSLANSGPVPWATENDATFVAEQVSHHPPSKQICTI